MRKGDPRRDMVIRVLGCHGSRVPGFNTTCFLLDGKILIDAGAVTSMLTVDEQMDVEYVLVTHAHLDHVRDITFLADNICYLRRERPLIVMGTQSIVDSLKTHLFNNVIWPDFSVIPDPQKPVLIFRTITPGEKFTLDGIEVIAIPVDHVVESLAYAIESEGKTVLFVGDTGPTEDVWNIARKVKNLKAVFIETSLPDSMRDIADMTGHLTPSSLALELEKLNTPNLDVYLYHMKIQFHDIIRREIDSIKGRNIYFLQDNDIIHI